MKTCPNYLKDYKEIWEKDPKQANLEWWKNAKFGLMIHYGLYSFLGSGEWVQLRREIPLNDYARMKDIFTASAFNADKITDLAIEAGMSYINLVCCHHDSFCLWDSKTEEFNSVNSPCGRSLVKELADACDRKGLGFFTYYTFALNWRHPYYVDRSVFKNARPDYKEKPKEYLYEKPEDFKKYTDYILKCMEELLLDCGTTAGIWLDLIMAYYGLESNGYFNVEEIYAKLREIRPDALISWKQGGTGTEDFASTEQHFRSLEERVREDYGDKAAEHHKKVWEINKQKHNEVCATMQLSGWSINPVDYTKTAEECYGILGHAISNNANLLLNIGPHADGSIPLNQEKVLKEIGQMIREKGYPTTGETRFKETGLDQ